MARKFLISGSVLAFALILSAVLSAVAQDAIQRKTLQDTSITDQYKGVQAYVTIAPGAFAAWHTHPGVEFGYVLDGGGDLLVKGQPTQHLKAGDSFVNPAGVPHALKNGTAVTHVLSVYIVDKAKPLATAAQAPE